MLPCSFLDCDFCQIGYGKKTAPSSVFMGWQHIFQSLRTGQGNTVISQLGQIFWGCLQSFLGTLLWTSVYNFQIKWACCRERVSLSGDCSVLLLLVSVCGITVSLMFPYGFQQSQLGVQTAIPVNALSQVRQKSVPEARPWQVRPLDVKSILFFPSFTPEGEAKSWGFFSWMCLAVLGAEDIAKVGKVAPILFSNTMHFLPALHSPGVLQPPKCILQFSEKQFDLYLI